MPSEADAPIAKSASLRAPRGMATAGVPVAFTCDGAAIEGLAGETLAASLTAAGRATFHPNGAAAARGLFCGMGVCRECLVSIDSAPNVRACMTPLEAGMRVEIRPPACIPPAPSAPAEESVDAPDVLVVGGGPAGLSAALAAARAGAVVCLLDERSSLGGQYFKQLAPSHRWPARPDRQFREGFALIEAVRAAGVQCHSNATVWGAFPGLELAALVQGKRVILRPKRLVLATGAFERGLPLPGWTLPGCMTTGAAQTLIRANGVAPGRRVVVAGNGPLNWQLAIELLAAGVVVLAIVEAAERFSLDGLSSLVRMFAADPLRTLEGASMMRQVRSLLAFGSALIEVHGKERVASVTLARIDTRGRPLSGTEWHVDADAVCVGYGFTASNDLARALNCRHEVGALGSGLRAVRDADGRSSVPEVFIAGDGAGIGGAAAAVAEGEIAGAAAAADLGHAVRAAVDSVAAARAALARQRRFQAALWTLFHAPSLTLQLAREDTPVCRCENVTLGALRHAVAAGELAIGGLKRLTRAGMGRCQGRYCGELLNEVIGIRPVDEFSLFAPRPPARPMPIGLIAREQPEE